MSSIEERLVRDIAAVTGGVLVTEPDLKDAREELDERIDSRRQHDRRRAVIAAAAAAIVIIVVGVAAFLSAAATTGRHRPCQPGPTTSDPRGGLPHRERTDPRPAPRESGGVDNGTMVMRFSPPDVISFDNGGQLFARPGRPRHVRDPRRPDHGHRGR